MSGTEIRVLARYVPLPQGGFGLELAIATGGDLQDDPAFCALALKGAIRQLEQALVERHAPKLAIPPSALVVPPGV